MKTTSSGWRLVKTLLAISFLTTCVSGCATVPGGAPPRSVAVDLPKRPAFTEPAPEPKVAAVDKTGACPAGAVCDARLAFRVMRKWGRGEAARNSAHNRWYDGVRNRYSGKPPRGGQ